MMPHATRVDDCIACLRRLGSRHPEHGNHLDGGSSEQHVLVHRGNARRAFGSAGFAYQLNYGYQLTSTKAGNLWLETPFTYVFQGLATFTGTTMGSIDRTGIYMTPGLRLKTPTYGRVSFYGALGGGSGSFSRVTSVTSQANGTLLANESRSIHPVADFAGGIDLRLSLRISLRAEGRDFLSAAHLGGVDGHHHPVFLAGLAFHF
jgi:hypothetical protein